MATVIKPKISVADYFVSDAKSEYKIEYFDGEIFMMAGASARHNLISAGLSFALFSRIRARGCFIFPGDMRLMAEEDSSYTYPDLIIVCGRPRYADTVPETLLNPTVIVEILSPSTEGRDRGRKLQRYRQIDTLQEYVLVSQSSYHVECFSREAEGGWLLTDAVGREANLNLPSLDCQISLDEIYQQVQFETET